MATVSMAETAIYYKSTLSIDITKATFEKENVHVVVNDKGEVASADLSDIELELPGHKASYSAELLDAEIKDNKFIANELFVERSFGGAELGGGKDLSEAQEEAAEERAFGVEIPPQRLLFNQISMKSDKHLALTYEKLAGIKIDLSRDPFSGGIDLHKGAVWFGYSKSKEKNFDDSPIAKDWSFPIPGVPIIPGLTFEVEIKPSLEMGGGFKLEGNGGRDFCQKAVSLSGTGEFSVNAGIRLEANLAVGLSKLASVYAGVFGELSTAVNTELNATVDIEKNEDTGAFEIANQTLGGAISAELKGRVGAHGGVRFLIYNLQLMEYTFGEWDIGKLELKASMSKQRNEALGSGWHMDEASFSAESLFHQFQKSANTDGKFNIKGEHKKVGEAMKNITTFKELKEELATIVENLKRLEDALKVADSQQGGVVIDDFFDKQAKALKDVYLKLAKQGPELAAEYQVIKKDAQEVKAFLEKETAKKKAGAEKHRDRLEQLEVMKNFLDDDPSNQKTYADAAQYLREYKKGTDWEKDARESVMRELDVYNNVKKHEEGQIDYYKDDVKKGSRSAINHTETHTARLAALEALELVYGQNRDELNQQVINTFKGKQVEGYKKTIKTRLAEKQKADLNSAGYNKAAEKKAKEAAAKKTSQAKASQATPQSSQDIAKQTLESHLSYEKSRAEVYSVAATEAKLKSLEEAQANLQKVIVEYQQMAHVFEQGQQIGDDTADLAKVLNYVQKAQDIGMVNEQQETLDKNAQIQHDRAMHFVMAQQVLKEA